MSLLIEIKGGGRNFAAWVREYHDVWGENVRGFRFRLFGVFVQVLWASRRV